MSPTAQTMPLGIEGFTYADLYAPARLKELPASCRPKGRSSAAFAADIFPICSERQARTTSFGGHYRRPSLVEKS